MFYHLSRYRKCDSTSDSLDSRYIEGGVGGVTTMLTHHASGGLTSTQEGREAVIAV